MTPEFRASAAVGRQARGANNKRIAELEADNARLREAINYAPHDSKCASHKQEHIPGLTHYETGRDLPCPWYHFRRGKCNCWKSRAASAPKSAPEAGTLNHLRALKPGWNSYGAPAIDERAIRAAEAILRTPGQAVPTVHGGVQIEWHCDGVDAEFEIGPDGQQVFEETQAEEVQRLKRELAEARKDSARLEWFLALEARDFGAFCEWHDLPGRQTSRAEASLDEWRAAIDAARRRGGPTRESPRRGRRCGVAELERVFRAAERAVMQAFSGNPIGHDAMVEMRAAVNAVRKERGLKPIVFRYARTARDPGKEVQR